jgi:hypothetical protein
MASSIDSRHPWTGDERHSERWSDPNGADSLKESQLAAGPRTISTASDITDTRITTASLNQVLEADRPP